jgi:hypothetical protein
MSERVHLDRIEGKRAVLLAGKEGRETISLPADLLPAGAKEGDAFDLALTPAKDDPVKGEVKELMGELFGN